MRLSTLFVLSLSFAAPVSAGGAPPALGDAVLGETWTPELAMRYRSIEATAVSADGSRIAYVVREAEMDEERSEFVRHIWVAPAGGGDGWQYTRGEASATAPAFSPDGRYLAFLSSRGEQPKAGEGEQPKLQIWRLRVAGGEAEQLTDAEGGVTAFRWSPDGAQIAYLARDPESEQTKADKKAKRHVIRVDQEFAYDHLYVLDLEAEAGEPASRRLTEGDFHVTDLDWSPYGATVAIAHQPDPRINTGFLASDLALVEVATGERTALVERPGVDRSPRFSPDGALVAFTSHGGRPEPVGLEDVFVVPAAGGSVRALAKTFDRDATLVGWSGSGDEVLVSEAYRTTRRILALPLDGGEPVPVSVAEGGVVSAVSLSRDGGTLGMVVETSDEPPEVYAATRATSKPVRVSRINADVPRPAMGRTERMVWTSPDGLEIEGLVTYPVGYEKGRRYAAVLNVHGGPAGVFGESFTGGPGLYQLQVFAQQGFVVLRPNPRGSTGYGKEFRFANVEDWGFGDYEDLMAGVDRLVELGVADADRLFVTGWSYGGYMTSAIVARTTRFRAASMGAGLPNLVSMVHTTDIPDYLVAHMGAELWQDTARFERHSAMYRLDQIATPTQIIHGAEDLRVPLSQGRELFVALERRGVPTEMLIYPRTPHGPREPKLLMDTTPYVLDWFRRFDVTGGK